MKKYKNDSLVLNGKIFYYDEIAGYSFRNSISIDGYEAKTLEFCKNWLNGIQEFELHTSGSTGEPKLITLSREQLEISALKTLRFFNLKPNDKILVCLNTEFIAGMMMLVRGFIGDLHMTIIPPLANPLSVLPINSTFDFVSFVPLQLQTIIEQDPNGITFLNKMKAILLGGAPLSLMQEKLVENLQVPVYHSYGMTETASHIAIRQINLNPTNQHYQILEGITISQDERCCLCIKGDVTNQEVIMTNDLVQLIDDNSFKWLGRADNTINSGGIKIQPEMVEKYITATFAHFDIEHRFFISSMPDKNLGEKLILILEGNTIEKNLEEKIKIYLKSNFPRFYCPKEFYYVHHFYETQTGKLDKRRILQSITSK